MKRVESVQGEIASVLRAARENRIQDSVKTEAAQEKGGVVFKAISCDDFGVIVGIGGAAGSVNKLDKDGEFLEKGDLMAMAFDFTAAASKSFKANHDDNVSIDAQLVESWVGAPIIKDSSGIRTLKADEALTPDMDVVGIDVTKGNETHWFVGVRPSDPQVVEAAKAGKIAGFSWSGFVNKTEI